VQSNSISFALTDPNHNVIPATVSYNNATVTAILTPNAPLAGGTKYTATVSGATDSSGDIMAGQGSWSFTTAYTLWSSTTTPAVASANDTGAVNLGVKFEADLAGTIGGIRFYKGSGNTGTHIGYLWDSTGHMLASATFTNETASGWQ